MFQSTVKKNNDVIQTTKYQTVQISSFSQQWGACFSFCLSHLLWKNGFHENSGRLYITNRTAIHRNFAKHFHSENKNIEHNI